jgi:transcriptional regulator with XRE-family HTH domain
MNKEKTTTTPGSAPVMTKGKRIRTLRIQHGFRQEQLARTIGVSKQTMYKYEFDIVTNIPSDKIEAIADALDVSPAYIMGWTRDADPNLLLQNHFSEPEGLYKYNCLDEHGKLAVDTILNLEYERCSGHNASIQDFDFKPKDENQ